MKAGEFVQLKAGQRVYNKLAKSLAHVVRIDDAAIVVRYPFSDAEARVTMQHFKKVFRVSP